MKEFRVLLVDDEEEFVKTLAERLQLRGSGFGSEVVLSGEAALHKIGDEPPDVMVLDLKMPGIDGIEVLRRVKQNYPDVQVIILTGHGSEKDEEAARRLGAFDYLQKPANIDDLVSSIKRAWHKKVESSLVAGAFAEEGMFDTAKKIMQDK
jgi:DNA-binding NtrC family response regulator